MIRRPPISTRTGTLFPYTTLFRSDDRRRVAPARRQPDLRGLPAHARLDGIEGCDVAKRGLRDRRFRVAHELHEATPQMAPAVLQGPRSLGRSEERRVGKECVSTC